MQIISHLPCVYSQTVLAMDSSKWYRAHVWWDLCSTLPRDRLGKRSKFVFCQRHRPMTWQEVCIQCEIKWNDIYIYIYYILYIVYIIYIIYIIYIYYIGVSKNGGFSPQIIHFSRVFHYKPSIFGVPLLMDTPIWETHCHSDMASSRPLRKCYWKPPKPTKIVENQDLKTRLWDPTSTTKSKKDYMKLLFFCFLAKKHDK